VALRTNAMETWVPTLTPVSGFPASTSVAALIRCGESLVLTGADALFPQWDRLHPHLVRLGHLPSRHVLVGRVISQLLYSDEDFHRSQPG